MTTKLNLLPLYIQHLGPQQKHPSAPSGNKWHFAANARRIREIFHRVHINDAHMDTADTV